MSRESPMPFWEVNPEELGAPKGWTNGMLAPAGGRILFVAGQTATDTEGRIVSGEFAEQFDEVLRKVLVVVREAGGEAEHIGRMTVYVTDMEAYRAARRDLGRVWRARLETHYPAMALVEVRSLVDSGALVEIEATAVLP